MLKLLGLLLLLLFVVVEIEAQPMPVGYEPTPNRIKEPTPNRVKDDDEGHKTWLFSVSGRRKPFNFFDDSGELKGFDLDVINTVCQTARKKCKITLSEFTECTFTSRNINYPGRGLMSGWFDACPGYVISIDRLGGFDFTVPYLNTFSTFTVAPGNPSGFNVSSNYSDYSNYSVTHLTGAATNAACLHRLGMKFRNITIAKNLPEARTLLLERKVDVLFSPRTNISGLEVLPQKYHCDLNGAGIMVKKGSKLPKWWNKAFNKVVKTREYKRLCTQARIKYKYDINCFGVPDMKRV